MVVFVGVSLLRGATCIEDSCLETLFSGVWEAHANGANLLYADGHAMFRSAAALKQEWRSVDGSRVDRTILLRRKDYRVPDPF